jgi:aminopeptidase N
MKDVSYNTKDERATLSLSQPIPAGDAILAIKFTGVMNNAMAGFYRAKYKPAVTLAASIAKEGDYHYMLSTQFEACDARRAFPCFDEPNLKASFEFEIEIPEDQVALSNMPEKAVSKGSKDGLKKVSFEKTPAMSTYVSGRSFCRPFAVLLIQTCSLLHGLSEISSMSKHIRSENTMAKTCPFESTPPEA